MRALTLRAVEGAFGVCRLDADAPVPDWATGRLVSVTRTEAELSIVCEEAGVPPGTRCESGWRAFEVAGPLEFSMVGVLSSLVTPLAEAGVSVFVLSTFDTDYVLVRADDVARGSEALRSAGHRVDGADE